MLIPLAKNKGEGVVLQDAVCSIYFVFVDCLQPASRFGDIPRANTGVCGNWRKGKNKKKTRVFAFGKVV
jgi:hypothetical protein